ncbi:MAG: rhomboid family intramembrane serine protease [Solirubrobacterales bacterium]|nr:rhomboid family intramembrane serine protease [Solirubrobacterales bacterium]MBV9797314.1 rhomboid family intramembrane serine protease [Solirubrobacterales bacterium]
MSTRTMSSRAPDPRRRQATARRRRAGMQIEGIQLLAVILALMWIVEVINSLDGQHLNSDGIHARDPGRLWGVLTSPFVHASFAHLISNTIPLVFMGLIIAMRGAGRVALVTLIVVVVGGLGTWLIAPGHTSTIGASGLVFGYAAYLLTRGLFDRSLLELLTGMVVAVIWGGALLSSLIPRYGISWQAHACGAIGGIVAAWLLSDQRARQRGTSGPPARALAK